MTFKSAPPTEREIKVQVGPSWTYRLKTFRDGKTKRLVYVAQGFHGDLVSEAPDA